MSVKGRGCVVAIVVVVVVLFAGGAATFLLLRSKDVDPGWVPCGVGDREVRAIAVDDQGSIYVAANDVARGDVFRSDDQCASFGPLGLTSEVLWSVDWLPRARAVCAGSREGMRCVVGGATQTNVVSAEIYFARETPAGVVAGGFPALWFGKMDLSSFSAILSPGRATTDAVHTDWATLVAGPGLLASLDGGATFAPVPTAAFAPRALAASGARVYAGGGSFGGFLFRSDDGGQTWTEVEMPGSQPETIVVPPGRQEVVLLGTHGDVRPGDAYLSIDGARTWRPLGCPGSEVHALAIDERFLYCGATSLSGTRGMWRLPLGALGLGRLGEAI